jgi:GNAT superfamily N-acetyltransferase
MIVRVARNSDYENWLPIWRGYQSFYKIEIPDATTAVTWSRFQDPQEPMHCVVAEINTELVGLVHFIRHRSCWTPSDYVYLQDLFVEPGSRGRGVGRALIEYVYVAAAESGVARVWWLTHQSNADAMSLYDQIAERTGFIQYRKGI